MKIWRFSADKSQNLRNGEKQGQGCYWSLTWSRMSPFRSHKNHRPRMTLHGHHVISLNFHIFVSMATGSVVVEFDWHHSIPIPCRSPVKCNDLGDTFRPIQAELIVVDFVFKFSKCRWDKFKWHRWIAQIRKSYHRTKNFDFIFYTTSVTTILNCSHRRYCIFFEKIS